LISPAAKMANEMMKASGELSQEKGMGLCCVACLVRVLLG